MANNQRKTIKTFMKKILTIAVILFTTISVKSQSVIGTIPSAAHIVLIGGGLNADTATALRMQIVDSAAVKAPIASPGSIIQRFIFLI